MMQVFNWRKWFRTHKEKIEITVETSRSWEVRHFTKSRTGFCPACETETIFIPATLGTQVLDSEKRLIENLLAEKKIHLQNKTGEIKLICFASLKREMEKGIYKEN